MTLVDLEALIKRCLVKAGTDPNTVDEVYKSASPPCIATMVATNLWIHNVPEDRDTRELRHQLKHLERKSYFDLEENW